VDAQLKVNFPESKAQASHRQRCGSRTAVITPRASHSWHDPGKGFTLSIKCRLNSYSGVSWTPEEQEISITDLS